MVASFAFVYGFYCFYYTMSIAHSQANEEYWKNLPYIFRRQQKSTNQTIDAFLSVSQFERKTNETYSSFISILFNDVQYEKHQHPIDTTLSGIIIDSNKQQDWKHESQSLFIFSDNLTVFNEVQLLKHSFPIFEIDEGIFISFKRQLPKALVEITFALFGFSISDSFLQL